MVNVYYPRWFLACKKLWPGLSLRLRPSSESRWQNAQDLMFWSNVYMAPAIGYQVILSVDLQKGVDIGAVDRR